MAIRSKDVESKKPRTELKNTLVWKRPIEEKSGKKTKCEI